MHFNFTAIDFMLSVRNTFMGLKIQLLLNPVDLTRLMPKKPKKMRRMRNITWLTLLKAL